MGRRITSTPCVSRHVHALHDPRPLLGQDVADLNRQRQPSMSTGCHDIEDPRQRS